MTFMHAKMNRNSYQYGSVHATNMEASNALTREMSLTGWTLPIWKRQGSFSRYQYGSVSIYLPYPLGFLLNAIKNFSARWFFLTTSTGGKNVLRNNDK